MQNMRDLLRHNLARSLESLNPLDRLHSAWPVACGRAMASRGSIVAYDPDTTVHIHVPDPAWREPFLSLRQVLLRDLARISGLPVNAIHFDTRKPE